MDADTFLECELGHGENHELIAGEVISTPRARTNAYNSIVSNIFVALTPWSRTRKWKVATRRRALRSGTDSVIYPSMAIAMGNVDPLSTEMTEPAIVIEVLESGQRVDGNPDRVAAIRQVPSVDTILLVSSGASTVAVHTRQADRTWSVTVMSGMDGSVELPALEVELPFEVIYKGLELDYASRLESLWESTGP